MMNINDDDHDDEIDDDSSEYETYQIPSKVNLYLIQYRLYGRNDKLLIEVENNYIGVDVNEIIDELKFKILGVEINTKDDNGADFHEVAERLQILNAELIAPIHGLTSASLKVFAEYYKDTQMESDDQE